MLIKMIIIIQILISSYAFGFELVPLSAEFRDSGKKTLKYFKLKNNTEKDVVINLAVYEKEIATKDFEVSPKKIKLKKGETKRVKLKYIGSRLRSESLYKLIASQKVKSTKDEDLSFLLEYNASIFVTPRKAKADFKIESSIKLGDKISVIFKNRGSKRTRLKNYKIELSQKGKKRLINFRRKSFREMGRRNILSGMKDKIVLKDKTFNPGKINARFIKVR